jgi:hypothetical protein
MTIYTEKTVLEYCVILPVTREVEVYHLPVSSKQPALKLGEGGVLTTALLPR